MRDKISKIRNSLPIVLIPIKFGGVAYDNQHDVLKCILWAAIPFLKSYSKEWCFQYQWILLNEVVIEQLIAILTPLRRNFVGFLEKSEF